MPLEGLWWAADLAAFTARRDKSRWDWTLMIMVPDWTTQDMFRAAVAKVEAGGKATRLDGLRLAALEEGTCVQTLHLGSFEDEAGVLDQLHHRFLPEHGWRLTGKHHEVYLSDPRKVAPDRLRTILRQPVVAA